MSASLIVGIFIGIDFIVVSAVGIVVVVVFVVLVVFVVVVVVVFVIVDFVDSGSVDSVLVEVRVVSGGILEDIIGVVFAASVVAVVMVLGSKVIG